MAARLIGFGVIGLLILAAILIGAYVFAVRHQPPRRELDVSVRPSLWWADTDTVDGGSTTRVRIVRVDNKTHEVLEARTLGVIRNDRGDYVTALENAQDRAYEAARKANLGLVRR